MSNTNYFKNFLLLSVVYGANLFGLNLLNGGKESMGPFYSQYSEEKEKEREEVKEKERNNANELYDDFVML